MEEKGWIKLHDRNGRTYRVPKESAVMVEEYGTGDEFYGVRFRDTGDKSFDGDRYYALILDYNETTARLTSAEVMDLGKCMIAEAKKMMESEEVFNE